MGFFFNLFQKRNAVYLRILSQVAALTCIIILQTPTSSGLLAPRSYRSHESLYNNYDIYKIDRGSFTPQNKPDTGEQNIPIVLRNILKRAESNTRGDRLCRMVCRPCDKVLSKSYSALCWNHCHRGGRAFDACVTMLTLIDQLDEEELKMLLQ